MTLTFGDVYRVCNVTEWRVMSLSHSVRDSGYSSASALCVAALPNYCIAPPPLLVQCPWMSTNDNKSAQNNLAIGPRRGAVRPIGPCGQWRAPNSSESTPSRGTIPKAHYLPLPHDPSDLWCQTTSRYDPPFFHNALDRQTDRPIVHGKVWWL